MAYYAAVISLKQTIKRLLSSSQILVLPHGRKILRFAFKEVISLELKLEKDGSSGSSNERVNTLKAQMREAICKLEDALESHISNQFLISLSFPIFLDVEEVEQEIYSFIETVKQTKKMMLEELSNPLPGDDDDAVSSGIHHFDGKKSKMVGSVEMFEDVKYLLTECLDEDLDIVSLWGMAGIGKTTLAKEVYYDEFVLNHYDCRVWVTIGQKYQLGKVFLADKSGEEGEEILVEDLYKSLKGRKYLIVVDDVWSIEGWGELKRSLPNDKNKSRVLLTTRLDRVADLAQWTGKVDWSLAKQPMPFLNKEESWHLLREKVFGEENSCPLQLQKAGKKIAQKCEGLPLTIVTVADILSKAEKTPEYWNKVADEKENSVFMDAYDRISNVLFPSYNYLPQRLKACFLYMGVIPPFCEIPAPKLINLWIAEGFLTPNSEDFARKCLQDLVGASVVLCVKARSGTGIKTCSIHSAFLHLCLREARKEKFLHVINSYAKSTLTEDKKRQRRLCIQNNILFGITEVYNSIESISTAHSLLCTGPYHQYPVPICSGLRLLRVLDALTVRFYKFPIEVLKLVQLKYLALTCNGNIPASVSKLWSLQFLIVRRHLSIKSSGADSSFLLPVEIWDMQELRHLQVMGSNLPYPSRRIGTALLPNLLILSDISIDSCSKEILERIPNLKKLGIQIELAPDHAAGPKPFWFFDHLLHHLHQLKSLKCVVVNPKVVALAPSRPVSSINITSFLPSSLRKLSLSGLGYPWEYMRIIAELPSLEVLKLRSYAFKGPEWVTFEGEFPQLECLLLEDIDLERWRASDDDCDIIPTLENLIIRHCYKLKEIPFSKGVKLSFSIDIEDCPHFSEEQIESDFVITDFHSSWDEYDRKLEP